MEETLKCLRCGRDMVCWKRNMYLDLEEGMIFRVPDWVQIDVYRCPGCGKLEFFQAGFSSKAEEHLPVAAEPDPVDTAGYYTPGFGPDVKCPVCGKEHPADDPFCPLCGTRRDQPCEWCGKWFPASEEVCPPLREQKKEISAKTAAEAAVLFIRIRHGRKEGVSGTTRDCIS